MGIIILPTGFMRTYRVIRGHYNVAGPTISPAAADDRLFFHSPTSSQNTFPACQCGSFSNRLDSVSRHFMLVKYGRVGMRKYVAKNTFNT